MCALSESFVSNQAKSPPDDQTTNFFNSSDTVIKSLDRRKHKLIEDSLEITLCASCLKHVATQNQHHIITPLSANMAQSALLQSELIVVILSLFIVFLRSL
jgi:hypothetical protein